jgi:hypothetical protein
MDALVRRDLAHVGVRAQPGKLASLWVFVTQVLTH